MRKTLTYNPIFKIGDTVQCLKDVVFIDGSTHKVGQKLYITENNVSFFNFNSEDYTLFLRKNE